MQIQLERYEDKVSIKILKNYVGVNLLKQVYLFWFISSLKGKPLYFVLNLLRGKQTALKFEEVT